MRDQLMTLKNPKEIFSIMGEKARGVDEASHMFSEIAFLSLKFWKFDTCTLKGMSLLMGRIWRPKV